MKLKKIKLCFKTTDYEGLDYNKYISICLDFKRVFYGIKFKTSSKEIKNGEIVNVETGYPEISDYRDCVFHDFCIYYKTPKSENSTWFKYTKTKYKQKV